MMLEAKVTTMDPTCQENIVVYKHKSKGKMILPFTYHVQVIA